MNKWLMLAVLLAVAGVGVGAWLANRGQGDPNARLPPPLDALQAHFVAAGIPVHGSLARAGGRERLRHNVHFAVDGVQRIFFVQWYQTPDAALAYLQTLQRYPASAASLANGELVLAITDWPVDDPLTQRVRLAFQSFAAPGAPGHLPLR